MQAVSKTEHVIGMVGLGWMGLNFATRLLEAGWNLRAYDLNPECVAAAVEEGAQATGSAAAALGAVTLLSLPTSDVAVAVIERDLLPAVRPGMVIVDLGTTRVHETRRLADRLAAAGAFLVDAPVSGDPRQPVFMFAGGEDEAIRRVAPVLQTLAREDKLTHGGPSGSGQILKGVNQLAMGLVSAAWLETVAFATRQGVSAETVAQAVGGSGGWRADLVRTCQQVAAGQAEEVDAKFAELPYFLDAAEKAGIALPLTEAFYRTCEPGPRMWHDNMDRPYTSFWYMLNHKGDD